MSDFDNVAPDAKIRLDTARSACAVDPEDLMFQASDFVTIALLVALEGLLSADNAMVLASSFWASQAPTEKRFSTRNGRRLRVPPIAILLAGT
jgi:hypothetical protein